MIDASKIHVYVSYGPISSGGFRTGLWDCKYEGRQFRVYASVNAHQDLDDQADSVRATALIRLTKNPQYDYI